MSRAALVTAIAAQTRAEILMTLRRGESVLVTVVIPVALMVFFASSRILPDQGHTIRFLLPGTIALAAISTGLVSLSIATAYERYYGVLKRLGSTPLPRWGLIAAKIGAVLAVETLQLLVLIAIGVLAFGWRPSGPLPLGLIAFLLGTSCFAGLGLAMAGTLRAEATLAAANGLFLVFLLLGGIFVPLSTLPGWMDAAAGVLPAAALANVLRAALNGGDLLTGSAISLLAWSIATPIVAARTFRWE